MKGKVQRIPAAAVCLLALLPGCGRTPAALPPPPASVDVKMTEYRFDHGEIPRGRVVFRARNEGQQWHRLSLLPLPAGFPPILEQLRGDTRQVVFTKAAIPDTAPASTGTFAVDLAPGRYAIVCLRVEPDGKSHAREGMATEFRIAG